MNKHKEHPGRRLAGSIYSVNSISPFQLILSFLLFWSFLSFNYPADDHPEPNIEALVNVAGVDFGPDPTACGQFDIVLDICLQNTGFRAGEEEPFGAKLTDLRLQLDLEGPLGASLIGLSTPPQMLTTLEYPQTELTEAVPAADRLPAVNPAFDGRSEVNLFSGSSEVYPGENFCLRLRLTIDPAHLSPEEAAAIAFQASVEAEAANHGYYQALDGQTSYRVNDLSDGGWNFNGTDQDPDNPEYLGSCWQDVQSVTVPGQVNISANILCGVCLEPEKLVRGIPPGCGTDDYPLGGFYRISVPGLGEDLLEACVEGKDIVNGKFTYSIRTVNDACNHSWGEVLLEDKLLPELACWKPHSSVDGKPLFCEDIDLILLEGVHSYKISEFGTVADAGEPLNTILDWTGYASAFDNCGDLTIYVSDELLEDGDCSDKTIERTFWVEANVNGILQTKSCVQTIHFTIPHLSDLKKPADWELSCHEEFALDENGNPHPEVTGYPTVTSGMRTYDLAATFCGMGAGYRDSERVQVCGAAYKIIRHWQVIDWCTEGDTEVYKFDQTITVVDDQGPEVSGPVPIGEGSTSILTFSTGPYDCTATFAVPMPEVTDECSDWTVHTEVFQHGIPVVTIPWEADRYVSGLPVGCYFFRYTVTDACGNRAVQESPFLVEDRVAPIAVCKDDLQVSLGGQGYARLDAADIDEGSSDNCGLIHLEVRRQIRDIETYACLDQFDHNDNGEVVGDEVRLLPVSGVTGAMAYFTPWEPYVEFTCCDGNEQVRIEMRIWDDANGNGIAGDTTENTLCLEGFEYKQSDNYNSCWLDLRVEDKIAPVCVPPLPVTVDCHRLPYDFDPQNDIQMTDLFGAATGQDNCPDWMVTELDALTDGLSDCGAGSFVRRFQLVDAKGIASDVCEQVVTMQQIHDYWIKFPADATSGCGVPVVDTVATSAEACDLLAVSVKESIYSASADECYKLFRTYSVINWCEYDGQSDPVIVSRDEDCDGQPGDESIFVIVKTQPQPDPCADAYGDTPGTHYEHVWYDRDENPFNTVPEAGTKGEDCDYTTNPTGFWKELQPITENEEEDEDGYPANGRQDCTIASVGYWQYTQVIKVYDDVNPTISFTAPEPFCAYSGDVDMGCPGEVWIDFQVNDVCSPESVSVSVEVDLNADGNSDTEVTDLLTGDISGYTLNGFFPAGQHLLLVNASDGCGNHSQAQIPFEITDCKAPTPICINGLVVELMPVIPAADVSGDGVPDQAAATIWATDFIASPVTDCSGPVTYSINRSLVETPDPTQTSIVLTCANAPTELIQIWAYDAAGNVDLCETYLMVQDNMAQCGGTGHGAVAGSIRTEAEVPVAGVNVQLSGNTRHEVHTTQDGAYRFDDLDEGFDYTVTPQLNTDPLNGLSTFDLILMGKHILGTAPLSSPYQLIAADINNSGSITSQDAIALRRLILNIDLDFRNNTSWRFVPADHQFANPADPWDGGFMEAAHANGLQGSFTALGFIGIKVGDLNGSAEANVFQAKPRAAITTATLEVDELSMQAGGTYRVPVRMADLGHLLGFQGTLSMDPDQGTFLDIEPGLLRAEHIGQRWTDEGQITFSWHRPEGGTAIGSATEVLFTLMIRAREDLTLSESLKLSYRRTTPEAYDLNGKLADLAINFGAEQPAGKPSLQQNVPNPFSDKTAIGFYLPKSGNINLTVRDATGRELYRLAGFYERGEHRVELDRSALPSVSTVLYYTLTNGHFTATRKMMIF